MQRSLMCGLTALIILTLTVFSNAQTASVRARVAWRQCGIPEQRPHSVAWMILVRVR